MSYRDAGTIREYSTRLAYAEWLQQYWWDDFITVTFRKERREPYYAINHVWAELRYKHYARRGFLVAEPHQSGDLHVHGLIAGAPPGWKPEINLPWDIWATTFKRFGRSRIQVCNNPDAVASYCAKYVLKQQSRVCDYYATFGYPNDWIGGLLDKSKN